MLKTTIEGRIDADVCASLNHNISRPFSPPTSGRIAVKVIDISATESWKFRVVMETAMLEPKLLRVLKVTSFDEHERDRPRVRYWLSRPPAERIAAVEFLRRQIDGGRARLRRVHRVLDCPWR